MKTRMIVVTREKTGNSFGDINLAYTFEVRDEDTGNTLDMIVFKAYESEGNHHIAYLSLQDQVEHYAKAHGHIWSGQIAP